MSLEPRCAAVEPLRGAAKAAGFAKRLASTNPYHHPGGAAPGDGGGAAAAAARAAPATADGRARRARRRHDGLGPCVGGSAAGLTQRVAASNASDCSLEHLGSLGRSLQHTATSTQPSATASSGCRRRSSATSSASWLVRRPGANGTLLTRPGSRAEVRSRSRAGATPRGATAPRPPSRCDSVARSSAFSAPRRRGAPC